MSSQETSPTSLAPGADDEQLMAELRRFTSPEQVFPMPGPGKSNRRRRAKARVAQAAYQAFLDLLQAKGMLDDFLRYFRLAVTERNAALVTLGNQEETITRQKEYAATQGESLLSARAEIGKLKAFKDDVPDIVRMFAFLALATQRPIDKFVLYEDGQRAVIGSVPVTFFNGNSVLKAGVGSDLCFSVENPPVLKDWQVASLQGYFKEKLDKDSICDDPEAHLNGGRCGSPTCVFKTPAEALMALVVSAFKLGHSTAMSKSYPPQGLTGGLGNSGFDRD